jgi:hypothetical protein
MYDFPIYDMFKSFYTLDYKKNILIFTEYYFSKIQETNYNDYFFGPMNPLTMCIYHNDTKLLQELLDTYRYPTSIKGDFTPLYYAFKKNNIFIVKLLCDYLSQCEYRVDLTRNDFEYLIKSPYGYCHTLIGTIPKKPELHIYSISIDMNHKSKLFYSSNVMESYNEIEKLQHTSKKLNISEENKSKIKEIGIYEIPFKYSFAAGSLGSIKFLHNYSKFHNKDFLLSKWKNVILDKWRQQLPFQILMAVLYWIFSGFVIVSMIFAKQNKGFKYISFLFLIILIIFKLLQFISYCNFKITM